MNTIDLLLGIDKEKFEKETKEVKIKSLSKKAGKDVIFTVKELNMDEFKRISDLATKKKRHGVSETDEVEVAVNTILKSVVEPNFKDEKLLEYYEVETPKELVKKILKAGEIMEVYREIEKVSGYNQDEDEQEKEEEDIKNS